MPLETFCPSPNTLIRIRCIYVKLVWHASHLPAGSQAHQVRRRMRARITASVTASPRSTVPGPWVTRSAWSDSHWNTKDFIISLWARVRPRQKITRQKVKCSSVHWMRAVVYSKKKVQREYKLDVLGKLNGITLLKLRIFKSFWRLDQIEITFQE